jgi:uncharacterized protein (TIGR00255 family)
MLKSMTGYGRCEVKDKACGEYFVEIQGVNRKYCDININIPKHFLSFENKVREIILEYATRGRINVFIGQQKIYGKDAININTDLIKEYYKALKNVKKELKLSGEIDIGLLAGIKDFITVSETEAKPAEAWPVIERALRGALKQFQSMREKEGTAIIKQIENSLMDIEKRVLSIEATIPSLLKGFKERLESRIKEVGLAISNTDERVQKEISILSERIDITEELHRIKSHFVQFRSLMKKNEPVGKTIDFLIQEMMREINTMGNKAAHTEISTHVVYVKSILEQMREQIQNVE